jgi:carbamoyl-phosphate synthase small subunit
MKSAYLYLKTGEIFPGVIYPNASKLDVEGEVVFNTGMTGYVEALTDPSYAGQILTFTYPLIGNYGVSDRSTWESHKIQVSALIVSTLLKYKPDRVDSLVDWLTRENIPCLMQIDTRALTKCLRQHGTLSGVLSYEAKPPSEFAQENVHWVDRASIAQVQHYGTATASKRIIVVDCGIKENIIRCLQQYPVAVARVPHDYDYTNEAFDGILISNGPGDPQECVETIEILKRALSFKKPVFGICLGAQLLALAVGARTYKLPYGHRAHNQPCLEQVTQRCYLTAQNHGYAIVKESLPPDWDVSFSNLNDHTVAGIAHRHLPFFAVQFHPEAAGGPTDTRWLFEKFYQMVVSM